MDSVKPIRMRTVVLVFTATLIPILFGVYVVLPRLLEHGISFFAGYLICFQTTPFVLMFVLMLILYRIEGNRFVWSEFKTRMRLVVNRKAVITGLVLLAVSLVLYLSLQPVSKILASTSLMSPPDWFGPDLNPLKSGMPGTFMGTSMSGLVWAPVVYLIGWFFNIAGEELLFRGYLLPRMELSFGGRAWILNGICWLLWHCFWRWQMIALVPVTLLLPLAAQKAKSTVPGIIAHGVMNLAAVIMIMVLVIR
ncbi:MAG TPA: CPBP family intramembrane metalloprotease [Spirochaetota bacterium]|nr:CPBP family intramembrane metalloprotease [Spirochaetota bacterium]